VTEQKIVDASVNPRIAGTRITVYTIYEFMQAGWREDDVAFWLRLTRDQVDAAIRFIEENRAEVKTQYERIMERINRGNPPELQAKLDSVHGAARARLDELRRTKVAVASDEGRSCGQ
jgi:uncharacterized protein (DUF433 family)